MRQLLAQREAGRQCPVRQRRDPYRRRRCVRGSVVRHENGFAGCRVCIVPLPDGCGTRMIAARAFHDVSVVANGMDAVW